MKKLGFRIGNIEDGWPPYDVEHMWVKECGDNTYKIENVPFFVSGIALGDIIFAKTDRLNYVSEWRLLHPSENSTVWILEHGATDITGRLAQLGCTFERGSPSSLLAINVPSSIDPETFFGALEDLEAAEIISIAVPADRFASKTKD